MADQRSAEGTPDPFQMWRDWLTQSEQQLNRLFNEAMSTDSFSQSSSRMMEAFLTLQRSMQHATELYFNALNIPSRTDILALGERLSGLEERLTDIESLLKAMSRSGDERKPGAKPPGPKRTKKPPQRGGTPRSEGT